jgi:hypothetical protein
VKAVPGASAELLKADGAQLGLDLGQVLPQCGVLLDQHPVLRFQRGFLAGAGRRRSARPVTREVGPDGLGLGFEVTVPLEELRIDSGPAGDLRV